MKNLKLFILLAAITSCISPTKDNVAKIENSPPYSFISDRHLNPDTLLNLLNSLDTIVKEPSSFWTNLANDTTYHPFHRAMCGLILLRRHVKDSTPLTELSRILNKANWIKAENIGNRCIFRGGGNWKLAAKMMNVKGSTFCIRIFPELNDTTRFKNLPYVNLKFRIGLSEQITLQQFSDFILFGKKDSLIKKTYIIAIG